MRCLSSSKIVIVCCKGCPLSSILSSTVSSAVVWRTVIVEGRSSNDGVPVVCVALPGAVYTEDGRYVR